MAETDRNPGARAWYALAVVVLATLFGLVDRQILVLMTEPLKHDMSVSDTQIGILQGIGPGLFAAIGVVALGWLADRTARQNILAVCIILWSAATAACGLARTFAQLLFACVAIALGEAALSPVFYSMIPDLFPGRARMTANLIYYGAVTIGAGFGVALSGAVIGLVEAHRSALPPVLANMAPWRLTFLAVAAPGVVVAALVALIGPVGRTSIRSAQEKTSGLIGYYRTHWRAIGGFYVAGGLYAIGLYAIYAWAPVYIIRVLKAAPTEVGYGVGAALSLGSVAGVLSASAADRLLRARFGRMTPMRILQASLALAAVPIALQLFAGRAWHAYALIGLLYALITMGSALSPSMLQDLSPAGIRGRVIAMNMLVYSMMSSMAPVLVGIVSDAFATQPRGLIWALVIVSLPCLAAAVLVLWLIDQPFRRTAEAFAPS